MTAADIRLSLRRTGGLAGLPMEASMDGAELGPEAAGAVLAALDAVEAAPGEPPATPDGFAYRLDVRRGDTTRTLSFGERDMPAGLAPVVRALLARAEPARR